MAYYLTSEIWCNFINEDYLKCNGKPLNMLGLTLQNSGEGAKKVNFRAFSFRRSRERVTVTVLV